MQVWFRVREPEGRSRFCLVSPHNCPASTGIVVEEIGGQLEESCFHEITVRRSLPDPHTTDNEPTSDVDQTPRAKSVARKSRLIIEDGIIQLCDIQDPLLAFQSSILRSKQSRIPAALRIHPAEFPPLSICKHPTRSTHTLPKRLIASGALRSRSQMIDDRQATAQPATIGNPPISGLACDGAPPGPPPRPCPAAPALRSAPDPRPYAGAGACTC